MRLLNPTHPRIKAFVSSVQFSRSNKTGGDEENRTPDPLLARQVLSQLSYAPGFSLFCLPLWVVVGLSGLEPLTSRLSGVRSNQLSYRPVLSRLKGGALKTK